MSWLVTGGAGYIGAHVTADLLAAGHHVIVVDNLSTGLAERLPEGVPLVRADVRDLGALSAAVDEHSVSGILHLAARKDVAESTADPLRYYGDNIEGVHAVLTAARDAGVPNLVYSSSAAVYGTPVTPTVSEDSATVPENPYGRSKLIGEWMVADAARAYGLNYSCLRYFNVAGAGARHLGDIGEANLLPRLLRAAAQGTKAQVFGDDYPTRDGSCVRDYIHVSDLSSAHVRAVTGLMNGEITGEVFNVGGGTGSTVLEMIRTVAQVTGLPLDHEVTERRAGDPASVVASAEKIAGTLSWRARYGLDEIVASAWEAFGTTGEQSD